MPVYHASRNKLAFNDGFAPRVVACGGVFICLNMTRKLEQTFIATDPTGKRHTLKCFRPYHTPQTFTGPANPVPGPLEIETENGDEVIDRGAGEYMVLATCLILHSHDPDRP